LDVRNAVSFITDAMGKILQRDESDDYTTQGDPLARLMWYLSN
jgi:hypothetical protein